jgi:hypothetical protein
MGFKYKMASQKDALSLPIERVNAQIFFTRPDFSSIGPDETTPKLFCLLSSEQIDHSTKTGSGKRFQNAEMASKSGVFCSLTLPAVLFGRVLRERHQF